MPRSMLTVQRPAHLERGLVLGLACTERDRSGGPRGLRGRNDFLKAPPSSKLRRTPHSFDGGPRGLRGRFLRKLFRHPQIFRFPVNMPTNKSEAPSHLMVKTMTSVRPIAFRVGWHTANRHSGEEPAPYSDTGTRSTLTVQHLDPVKRRWVPQNAAGAADERQL